MSCRICNHPIVVGRLKTTNLDTNKDVYYKIIYDICDYCNGPIIGVRRYDRQDPITFYDENPNDILNNVEFYTKEKNDETRT